MCKSAKSRVEIIDEELTIINSFIDHVANEKIPIAHSILFRQVMEKSTANVLCNIHYSKLLCQETQSNIIICIHTIIIIHS